MIQIIPPYDKLWSQFRIDFLNLPFIEPLWTAQF